MCTNVLAVLVNVLVAMLTVLICYCVSIFYISWLFCVLKGMIRIWRTKIYEDTFSIAHLETKRTVQLNFLATGTHYITEHVAMYVLMTCTWWTDLYCDYMDIVYIV